MKNEMILMLFSLESHQSITMQAILPTVSSTFHQSHLSAQPGKDFPRLTVLKYLRPLLSIPVNPSLVFLSSLTRTLQSPLNTSRRFLPASLCLTVGTLSTNSQNIITDLPKFQTTMNLSELKYSITAFRTKKTYLIFLITQLVLCLAIVCIALTSNTHFRTPIVLVLQLALFLSLAFDLLIVRWVSEGRFCSRMTNVFDFVLLCIFAGTLLFLVLSSEDQQKDYRELLQVDDVIVIIIVITRYVIQVVRLINEIRHTRTNRRLQSEIKKVNLNEMEFHSTTFNDAFHIDNQIRAKITAFSNKNQQFVEDFDL